MKASTYLLTLLFLICSLGIQAQQYKEENDLIQNEWGLEKRELIKRYMDFKESEATAFWSIYDEYADKRKKLGNERLNLLRAYAGNFDNMSDDKAKRLTEDFFDNNMAIDKLQRKYFEKLSKAIAPMRAAQFIQFEKYLDTAIRYEIQTELPFLRDVHQMKGS